MSVRLFCAVRFEKGIIAQNLIKHKEMKRLLFAVMAIAAVVFTGCSKDDEGGFDYDKNQVYGTWRVTHVDLGEGYVDVVGTIYEDVFDPTYITFNSNGTFSTHGYFGAASGTYTMKGKTITTYLDGEELFGYDILSLSGDIGEAEMYDVDDPSDRVRMRLGKQ